MKCTTPREPSAPRVGLRVLEKAPTPLVARTQPSRPSSSLNLSLLAPLCFLLAVVLGAPLGAQGDFVNFEVPEVKSIDVARVAGHDYLLVCNTPDNSVEIYDTHTNRMLQRVPVGLAPVTVRYNPYLGHFYTCNQVGDSVSMVKFWVGNAGALPPKAAIVKTVWVGDEPADIAFTQDQLTFFVTLKNRSAVSWLYSFTLNTVHNDFGKRIDLTFPIMNPFATRAVKEPRRMIVNGNDVFVLNYKGGVGPKYDYDLMALQIGTSNEKMIGKLGSTNAGMARAANGDLFVVGTKARNDLLGEAKVASAATGFTESHLWIVKNALGTTHTIQNRDLNLNYATDKPVAKGQALAQPTDILLIQSDKAVKKVFLTAFHSDRIAILYPNTSHPSKWGIKRLNVPMTLGYPLAGPRALAFKDASSAKDDPGMRVYVKNQLSNSVTVIDPVKDVVVAHFRLRNDPTPAYVKSGREFLYSANHSGNGFVSCASCHVDGGTDSLVWDLGLPSSSSAPKIPTEPPLVDGVTGQEGLSSFPPNKGPMMTQSLQGLVNHHVDSKSQNLLTNAPYHWRGDRASFLDFNPAFVSLMGKPKISGTNNGLTTAQMLAFERMVNSIAYPPNPDQSPDRVYSGTFGKPDLEDGNGALRGLKVFHTKPFPGGVIAGRSCVQCHSIPDGSNNRITLVNATGGTGPQPIESAQTRTLYIREGMLEKSNAALSTIRVTENGLLHDGHQLLPNSNAPETVSLSINWFMFIVFGPAFLGNGSSEILKLVDLIAFVREFDAGIAPIIGAVHTVTLDNKAKNATTDFFNLVEGQARKANGGVAVYLRNKSGEKGYFFDVSVGSSTYGYYRQIGGFYTTRANLLKLVAEKADVMVVTATPVGSEQRVASLTGVAPTYKGNAPYKLTLQPMVPNDAWKNVPQLTKNWPAGTGANDFKWDGKFGSGNPTPTPDSMKTLRIYQYALMKQAPKFGLTKQRHEAPRRFRVAGYNIRHGAKLRIWIPRAINGKDLSQVYRLQEFTIPIFPTSTYLSDGRRVWESTVEADGLATYILMLGGPDAPGVRDALNGKVPEPPKSGTFNPVKYNSYTIQVVNKDATVGTTTKQPITIQ